MSAKSQEMRAEHLSAIPGIRTRERLAARIARSKKRLDPTPLKAKAGAPPNPAHSRKRG
jgi:hypothetical protein